MKPAVEGDRLTPFGVLDKYFLDEEIPWGANHAQRLMERLATNRYAIVEIPAVAHKGPYDTDASAFRAAAERLDGGYEPGGSNVKRAISRLLRSAAKAIETRPGNDTVAHLLAQACKT